jgi:ribosomal protein S18 acetylase RimI-like enzyme
MALSRGLSDLFLGKPMSLDIRDIVDADIPEVIALWNASGISRPWNDPVRDIAFARRNEHSTVLVGREGDQIVASAMVGEDGHRGWVYYVAIAPERQRSGLGRTMMQAAEDWLIKRGVWKVQLLVRGDNTQATNFYEQLGYRDTRSVCLQKILES